MTWNNYAWLKKKLKWNKNCNNYISSPWMQPLKASKWAYGQKLFLYSAVKACMTFFTFVESRGYAFLNPNTVHNQLRITEESWLLLYFILWRQWKNTKTKTLKCYKIFPVVRRKSPHELWQTQQSMNPFATLSSTKNQINNSVLKNRKTKQ